MGDASVRPFQTILCPVDFSSESRIALQHAVAVARRTGGRLTVMYADDPMLASAAAAGYDSELLKKATMSELRRMLVAVGVPVDRDPSAAAMVCAVGRPAREIVKAAKRLKADLIVLGTQGRSGASKFFFGSTTARLLREAPAPVLAVPPSAVRPPKRWPGRLIGAVDLGPGDRDHIRRIAALARAFHSSLLLAHVVSRTDGPPWLATKLRASDGRRLAAARARLRKLAASVDGIAVESRVLLGDPATELAALAADVDAGVIVLTLRAGHGLFAPRQGAISYRILCGSDTPVLALNQDERAM